MIETNFQTENLEYEVVFDEGQTVSLAEMPQELETELETVSLEAVTDVFQQGIMSGFTVAGVLMLFSLGVCVLVNIFKKA